MADPTLKKDLWRIVAVISGLSIVSVAVVLILTEGALAGQKREILEQKMNTASTLAGSFQLRFEDATKVLKIAAESTEFERVNNAASVSEEYNGIPIGLEEGKRKILRDLHENYGTFDTVHFMLPNGDIYILEPYERQLILPRLNFADREYYQGAIATTKPYASDVIISTASLHRVAPIAGPIYYSDGSLTGLIVGATDLVYLEEMLEKELNLVHNNRVIYVDSRGNVIEDVSEARSETFTTITSLTNLQSVQKVVEGESGHHVEVVDGKETLVVYHPAIIGERQWGVLFMQPTEDAYSSVNYLRNQVYVMLAIIVSIVATAGYFLISFRLNSTIAKQLATANAELLEKDKVKDEFLRIASHELRTPIQPILGYSSLGERGLVKDGNEAWKIVHKEAKRLMKLANNIVDISMAQSGILTYKMEKIGIVEVVRSTVEAFRPIAQEKKISLELSADERFDKIEIDGDALRLKKVFVELLDNAFKFTEKGHVKVECVIESDKLVIRVSDTGSSIPLEILPKLFGLFSSASGSDATSQGAGLGLFVCKTIITAHGGAITARNNNSDDGKGTGVVFEVTLPLYSLQENASTTQVALS